MTDISKAGDEDRRAEIDKLPEIVEVTLRDGDTVKIAYRSAVRRQDDEWVALRDSEELFKILMGDVPSTEDGD